MTNKSLNDHLISYAQFRARAVGYRYSGKTTWEQIKQNKPIRGAVHWNVFNGKLSDPEYPFLLLHFESQQAE